MSDEEQEYVTLDEAAQALGTKKSSLYYYLRALAIEPRKFPLNKHAYISKTDVERIRVVRSSPWKIAQTTEKQEGPIDPTPNVRSSGTVLSVPDEQAKNGEKPSINRSDAIK